MNEEREAQIVVTLSMIVSIACILWLMFCYA